MDEQESTIRVPSDGSPRAIATWTCPACELKIPTTTSICPQDGTTIDAQKEMDQALADTYEFIGTIGTGGMGVIYKARQKMLDKIVAIKMLHSHLLNIQSMLRFQQEAKAASSLKHPNVISVHDFGISEQGQPYMVMDYIEGITLADLLQSKGALTLPEAMDIFLDVCEALEHAHGHSVLHRDLKSSNIMLSEREDGYSVHLLDFGIAKFIDTECGGIAQQLTQTGEVIGSPLYMSPEQCMGKKVDQRSDIYSLGCILYEAVTGSPPHRGDSMIETIFKHLNETPLRLPQARPDINFPETFDNLVMKLLAKKPEDRVQSITQVKEALLSIQSGALKGGFRPTAAAVWSKLNFSRATATIAVGAVLAVAGLASLAVSDANLKHALELKAKSEKELRLAVELNEQEPAVEADNAQVKLDNGSEGEVTQERLLKVPAGNTLLYLKGAKISDQTLWTLLRFQRLRALNLSNTPITDYAIKPLLRLKALRNLTLDKTRLTPNGLAQLAECPWLLELHLDTTETNDETLLAFSRLPNLQILEVRDTAITDKGLENLLAAKNLRTLSISGTAITNRGLATVAKMNLTELNMWDTNVSPGLVEQLKGCKKLERLCLSRVNLSADDLANLSELSSLNYLQLYHIKNLKDDDLRFLTKLNSLKKLHIEDCPLSDNAGKYLNQIHELDELSINDCKITDRLITEIGDLQKLEKLWLDCTNVRNLKSISKLRNLQKLSISRTALTDAGIKEIAALPNLTSLEIWFCPNISRRGLAVFKRTKPNCKIDKRYFN